MRLGAITLRQMRAVAAVAEHGSLTAAGAALGLTTPAIYTQIRTLEDIVGATLVRRANDQSGSVLTESGAVMLDAVHRMEATLSQAADEITAISRGLTGRVALGVVSTGKYFAPRLVRRLQLLCPEIEVVLKVGNREFIIDELERHGVDLAVMGRPPRDPPVVAEPLGVHPHGLVAAPDHPLASGRKVTANDLISETILSREEGSGTRILMGRYLDRIGEGRIFDFMVMDSNETIKQAAMAGLGIAFLSLHTVTDELATGRLALIRAEGLPVLRHWFLVRPSAEPERPATARVHRTILGLEGKFLPDMTGHL
ncbi:MAG: LysR family transcriptional regulator [Proteobacteria bacterium]|nr:LysR family transcriptional regulator [Pseudomonadota bacterium]